MKMSNHWRDVFKEIRRLRTEQKEIDYSDGLKTGLFPLIGEVFTEIEALETLFDLYEVLHISSGGIGGAEGAVTLLLIGDDEIVQKAFDFCQKLKTVKPFVPTLG